MRVFSCRVCGSSLFFENTICVSCQTDLAFSREERAIVPVDDNGRYVDADGSTWYRCTNLALSGCTWLTEVPGGYCFSCGLTRTRPSDEDLGGLREFKIAEEAKRRLVVELDTLGFPIVPRSQDEENGLAFDLPPTSPATTPTARRCGSTSTSPTARCWATSATRSGTTSSGSTFAAP